MYGLGSSNDPVVSLATRFFSPVGFWMWFWDRRVKCEGWGQSTDPLPSLTFQETHWENKTTVSIRLVESYTQESSILPVCLMRLHEHPRIPILIDDVEHLLRLLLFYGSNWIQSPGAEEPLCSCRTRSVSRLFAISIPVLNHSERFPECVFKGRVSTKSSNGANQVEKWNPWHRGTRPSCSASPVRGSSPQEQLYFHSALPSVCSLSSELVRWYSHQPAHIYAEGQALSQAAALSAALEMVYFL